MTEDVREVPILLKYVLDKSSLEAVRSGNQSIDKALETTLAKATKTEQQIEILSKAAVKMQQAGTKVFASGVAILGGLFAQGNKYVQTAKESDEITQRWSASMQRIENSQQKLTKSAATVMLPVLEKVAGYAEKFATYIEKNPEVAQAAVNLGLGLTIAGAMVVVIGKVLAIATKIAQVINAVRGYMAASALASSGTGAAGALTTASAGAAIGSALVLAIAAYIGAKAGELIGNKLGEAIYGEDYKKQDLSDALQTASNIQTIAIYKSIKALEESGIVHAGVAKDYWKAATAIKEAGEAASTGAKAITSFEKAIVDAYVAMKEKEGEINEQYLKDVEEESEQYSKSLSEMAKSYEETIRDISASSAKALQQITASFQADLAQMDAQYASQRSSIIQNGNKQIEQIERDHQDRLRELKENHEARVYQLTLSRDARGLREENENYKKEVAAENKRASEAVARAKEETAQQLAELDRRYAQERAQREAAYQQELEAQKQAEAEQLAQARETYGISQEKATEAHEEQLRELEKKHQDDLLANREAFYSQIQDLNNALSDERGLRNEWYAVMLEDARAFMEQYRSEMNASSTPAPGYANGGYAGPGLIRIEPGQKEFVLNSRSTKMAESLIGGPLTQKNLLGALGKSEQNIVVQVGAGMTLMETKRLLQSNQKNFADQLAGAIGVI